MNLTSTPPLELTIRKVTVDDLSTLSELGQITFIESHGHSAPKNDIAEYIRLNYTIDKFKEELANTENHYYLIFKEKTAVGFSKVCMNNKHNSVDSTNVAKLERLYVLKEHHDQSLGYQLFNFNIKLCKKLDQVGIWLNVWTENTRAINFYRKVGFKKIGEYNFKISPTHSNPNLQLFLRF
jgi:ribosomal protein S18 acetylase RimI-like enzyme